MRGRDSAMTSAPFCRSPILRSNWVLKSRRSCAELPLPSTDAKSLRRAARLRVASHPGRRSGTAPRTSQAGRMRDKIGDILCRLCRYAGLLQETEVSEPVDKPELPLAKRRIVPIRETAAHPAAVRQWVARMPADAIDVELDIGHADLQHCVEIFHRPHCVD